MGLKESVYYLMPEPLRERLHRWHLLATHRESQRKLHSEFVAEVFDSPSEYDRFAAEFDQSGVTELLENAFEEFSESADGAKFGTISVKSARDWYAVTRKLRPSTVLETGVCNGFSTVAILQALEENHAGRLHSIDYPLRADESLAEFRQETFRK
jgi:hypothetical protein